MFIVAYAAINPMLAMILGYGDVPCPLVELARAPGHTDADGAHDQVWWPAQNTCECLVKKRVSGQPWGIIARMVHRPSDN